AISTNKRRASKYHPRLGAKYGRRMEKRMFRFDKKRICPKPTVADWSGESPAVAQVPETVAGEQSKPRPKPNAKTLRQLENEAEAKARREQEKKVKQETSQREKKAAKKKARILSTLPRRLVVPQ
ncbi:hypothetical protein BGZ73_002457, partial [Actinomortierella ambigua]